MATVELLTSELVVPAHETPTEGIWLSNLDLAERRWYTATVYLYQHTDSKPGFFAADVVKGSLAEALVAFYPLAGGLGRDAATGRFQIDCTGEGAVFLTARSSDYVVDDLAREFVPCPEMRDLFVPAAPAPDPPCPLLLAQVTRLRCGGAVLGLALHHWAADARRAAHFVQTWARIARGDKDAIPLPQPCFDHRLLRARPTRTVLYDHCPEYKPKPEHEKPDEPEPAVVSAILWLSRAQVRALKSRCEGASTFRAVAALVWQCTCRARSLPADAEVRLFSVIDVRARLAPPLPPGYFGNAVVRTSVAAAAGVVVGNPTAHAARLLLGVTSQGDEYARSLLDFLEDSAVVDRRRPGRSAVSRAHLRAVSWMGMSLHDPDFGWGAPVFMGPALIYHSGFLYVMNQPAGNDGAVTLALSLERETMPEFRKVLDQELASLLQV